MKFIITTDRNGKAWLLNPAHIVAVTARSGKGHDWDDGAWVYLVKNQEATDSAEASIALNGKEAVQLLRDLT